MLWVDSRWNYVQVHRAIASTFGINFRFKMMSAQGQLVEGHDISHAHGETEPLDKLDLFLRQPGQIGLGENWDTPTEHTPAEYVVRINTTYSIDSEQIEIVDTDGTMTILDLLQAMYEHDNGLLARAIND
jgi:hypothetical protein